MAGTNLRLFCALLVLMTSTVAHAQSSPPARVMLLGTFHFSDPGLDAVKTRSLDVTTDASQRYLEALSRRIAAEFRPTHILLEYSPDNDDLVNERLRAYVDGEFELPVNEIYQLGFRIAGFSNVMRVGTFDHREVSWEAEAMLSYARQHDPAAYQAFEDQIAAVTARVQHDQDTLSLRELLMKQNDPRELHANKALYVSTNAIGAGDGYSGADAAASWWRRNFRIYANIQKIAQPGERVLVIGGSGHIAIIADLLALDGAREAVDIRPLLQAGLTP